MNRATTAITTSTSQQNAHRFLSAQSNVNSGVNQEDAQLMEYFRKTQREGGEEDPDFIEMQGEWANRETLNVATVKTEPGTTPPSYVAQPSDIPQYLVPQQPIQQRIVQVPHPIHSIHFIAPLQVAPLQISPLNLSAIAFDRLLQDQQTRFNQQMQSNQAQITALQQQIKRDADKSGLYNNSTGSSTKRQRIDNSQAVIDQSNNENKDEKTFFEYEDLIRKALVEENYQNVELYCYQSLKIPSIPNDQKGRLLYQLAISQNRQRKYFESEKTCLTGLELPDALNSQKVKFFNQLAQLQTAQENYAEAEKTYLKAIELFESFEGLDDLKVIILQNLAVVQNKQEKYVAAEKGCSKALEFLKLSNQQKLVFFSRLIYSQNKQGKYAEAEKSCLESFNLMSSNHEKSITYSQLAYSQYYRAQYESALENFKLARQFAFSDVLLGVSYNGLSQVNEKIGNTSEALVYNVMALSCLMLLPVNNEYKQEARANYVKYGSNEEILKKVSKLFWVEGIRFSEQEIWQAVKAVIKIKDYYGDDSE